MGVEGSAFHEEDDFVLSDPFFYDFLSVLIGELYFGLFLEVWVAGFGFRGKGESDGVWPEEDLVVIFEGG